ncbi:MAG: hypothetical protein VKL41_21925 [Snowella sp.]|nr:hypothetical protein [Snowella sp.]
MNSKQLQTLNLKLCVMLFCLFIGFFTFTVLRSYAQSRNNSPALFYIDCIATNNQNYHIGIREVRLTNRSRYRHEVLPGLSVSESYGKASVRAIKGEAMLPFSAVNLPRDSTTRVRFGFMDNSMNKIPNKFIHLGPLENRLYVSFPCPEGGLCLVVTDEAHGTITSKFATIKTSFPGCP